MTDATNKSDQDARPKKPWRWWHIALAILLGLFVLSRFGGSPDLKVISSGRGSQLQIQNIGRKPVQITGLKVNDRDECKVLNVAGLARPDAQIWPVDLDTGGVVMLMSFCPIAKAKVTTNSGSASYEFK